MAKTKEDIRVEGKTDAQIGNRTNPYKSGSWQAAAWDDGYEYMSRSLALRKAEQGQGQSARDYRMTGADRCDPSRPDESRTHGAVYKISDHDNRNNLPRDTAGGISIPFPAAMPSATREHIRRLEAMYGGKITGDRMARISHKIERLYAKWGARP